MAKIIACGDGVECKNFGGEGTGKKSYFDTTSLPLLNTPYYFVV